jgi:hypothetical protein
MKAGSAESSFFETLMRLLILLSPGDRHNCGDNKAGNHSQRFSDCGFVDSGNKPENIPKNKHLNLAEEEKSQRPDESRKGTKI